MACGSSCARPSRSANDAIADSRAYVSRIAKNNKGVAFIKNALEPIPLQTSAMDQSMQSIRAFQVEEASRIFGVPLQMLGVMKSNVTGLRQSFWNDCVKGHVQTLLSAMTMKLLNQRFGPAGGQFRFDVDPTEMLKGDPDTMAKLLPALGDAQRPAVITPSEWRRAGGWPTAMPEENDTDVRESTRI